MEIINSIGFALNAVLPIILLVILGFILKKIKIANQTFVQVANKIVFRVTLPVMLFLNMARADLSSINWGVIGYCVAIVIGLFIVGVVTVVLTIKDPKQKGSVLQSVFRSNYSIIGLPLVSFLCVGYTINIQEEAMVIATLIAAFTIPVFNILAVISLSVFLKDDEGKKVKPTSILYKIITNPLIIGITLGLIAAAILPLLNGTYSFTASGTNDFVNVTLRNIGSLTTPLALIALGAQFEFGDVGSLLKQISIGVLFRCLIAPLVGIGVAIILVKSNVMSFGPTHFPALIALFCTPSAVSSVAMAKEMGSDEVLSGQIVVWTTIMSVVSIVVAIVVLKGFVLI